jgi:hypothetical protein
LSTSGDWEAASKERAACIARSTSSEDCVRKGSTAAVLGILSLDLPRRPSATCAADAKFADTSDGKDGSRFEGFVAAVSIADDFFVLATVVVVAAVAVVVVVNERLAPASLLAVLAVVVRSGHETVSRQGNLSFPDLPLIAALALRAAAGRFPASLSDLVSTVLGGKVLGSG